MSFSPSFLSSSSSWSGFCCCSASVAFSFRSLSSSLDNSSSLAADRKFLPAADKMMSSKRRNALATTTTPTTEWFLLFVVVAVVAVTAFGGQWGRGGGVVAAAAASASGHDDGNGDVFGDDDERPFFADPSFDEMTSTMTSSTSGAATDFFRHSGFPSIFESNRSDDFWSRMGPKVTVNRKGKCVFSLTWEKGAECLEFAAFADVKAKAVTWRYRHAEELRTETSSSARSESVQQSFTLDKDCFLNDAVVEMRLAGYMTNDASNCVEAGRKVEIIFPSKTKALALQRNGDLPEGTVKALEEGDVEVLDRLTDQQACALLLDGRNCHNLDRSLPLAHAKSEEALSEYGGRLRASRQAKEEGHRIPLPQIGHIDREA